MKLSFDYIVVGAGSAGCVLASRLSEDPSAKVLLVEAGGGDGHPLLRMPLAWPVAAGDPRFSWGYVTEPEPTLGGRRLPLARGKVLGGSSAVNGSRYSRGHPRDYDQWRQQGLQGWGYEDVLPYFRRSEKSWRGADQYHGGEGELNVRPGRSPDLLSDQLSAACKAAGYTETDDLHGEVAEGLAEMELTITDWGRRLSSYRAFIKPVLGRKNLTVMSRALVTHLRFKGDRAVGIEYVRRGQTAVAQAEREVILAGGAYNSPQLLMLSGIGPADELRTHGITPIVDSPSVGRNLTEHPLVPLIMETEPSSSFLRHLRVDRSALRIVQWFFTGGGPFATNGCSAGLMARTREGLDRPDVQLIFAAGARDSSVWWPGQGSRLKFPMQCSVSIQHPEARGHVTLRSSNPAEPPRILLNLFGAQADIDVAIAGLRMGRDIFKRRPLSDHIKGELLPGAATDSTADLTEHVRRTAATTSHPCGTCRMGIDEGAVVDGTLRVRGVRGLRVVDASVMPTITCGHINAPTIMIAEKAADMIKQAS